MTSLATLVPYRDPLNDASGPLGPNDSLATEDDLQAAIAALNDDSLHEEFFGVTLGETIATALKQALSQVGYQSPATDNQRSIYNAWYVEQGYGSFFADCAWCAIGQCWNGREGSIPAAKRSAGALALLNNFPRIPTRTPGALVGYSGPYFPAGHVELIIKPDPDPNYVWTVGFNTTGGGQGAIGVYYIRRYMPGNVVGFSWPSYSQAPAPAPPPAPGHLTVDGDFGPLTIEAMQRVLKVAPDGDFGPATKKALQSHLGVTPDGDVGPITVRALQRHVGATPDGVWGSQTTSDLQVALNANRF